MPVLIQTIKKSLTSAQILALNTTPQELIPAPGAGYLVIVDYVSYNGSGAYTQADGAGLVYHGTAQGADAAFANAQNPFVNGVYVSAGVFASALEGTLTTEVGLGVDIKAITTNPTVGTTPLEVTVQYRVIAP